MKKRKKKFKYMVLLILPLLITYYVSSIFFSKEIFYYNSSKSFMTYVVYALIILTCLFMVIFTILAFKAVKKNNTKSYLTFIIFIVLFITGQIFISYNLGKVSSSIKKVTNNYTTYSSSLIVLNDNKDKSISSLDKIGMISDKNNIESYIIPKEIIKENNIDNDKIVSYDDFLLMLDDLYDKKIDGAFVSSSFSKMFSSNDKYSDIKNKVSVIETKDKKMKKQSASSSKTLTEPFSVLLMGVDSEKESLESSSSLNGDALMLITFNPSTMNATILSIPRDTYVPISCYKNKAKNKINAAAYGGDKCMIKTIEDLTDIKIDYWVKINFKGVVKLVDALGGVEVDVPYAFCEQNSNRDFGKYTIFVEKGRQTLNGEQALAFSRNRHTWPKICGKKYSNYTSNDFIRGQNQQQVVNAMLNKLKSINSLEEIYSILDVVGSSIDTNISKETMITGFDTFKNLIKKAKNINSEDFVGTQRLYLSGYDKMMNNIYYFMYYKQSLEEIEDAMKINLELEKPEMDKEFSFSINEPYESTQIGKGTYKY